jgi:hypothetical protein
MMTKCVAEQWVKDEYESYEEPTGPSTNAVAPTKLKFTFDDPHPDEPQRACRERSSEEPRSRVDLGKKCEVIGNSHPSPQEREHGLRGYDFPEGEPGVARK